MKAGLALLLVAAAIVSSSAADQKRLLVVTVTIGFPHSSVTTAEKVIRELGEKEHLYTIDVVRSGPRPKDKEEEAKWLEKAKTELGEKMSKEGLAKYDGVIFANTTGDLPLPDPAAFIEWVKSGKAFIGTHSASDTFHGFPGYIEMIGGEFQTHGAQASVECANQDQKHPSTASLGRSYQVRDEIYIQKNFHREKVHGLLTLDKHPNTGLPGDYPIAWCKDFGQGKVFYTALGHREDVWDPAWTDRSGKRENGPEVAEAYQKHLLGGIKWALGLEAGSGKPQRPRATLAKEDADEGFTLLFDGEDLNGWKLRNADGNKSWSVQNKMLVNLPGKDHGNDLVSEQTFKDFTIRYAYMIPKGANSGLYLRGRYEIQILDDADSNEPKPGGNGAIYNLKPVSTFASRPAGQWNQVEATIKGNKVSVKLNGKVVHEDVEVNAATGGELDSNLSQPGPIMLQGDHGAVAFRNIRIKSLN